MARKIVVKNDKKEVKEKTENTIVKKSSRRFLKTKVSSSGKVVSEPVQSEAPYREAEIVEKVDSEEDKFVLVRKKQKYEEYPELYERESAPIMTFDKDKVSQENIVLGVQNEESFGWESVPYKPVEKKQKDIDPRTPEEKFQEYKSRKLEEGSNNILYDGKVYEIKNEYFAHFIKEAQDALYSNIGSRNWARKVAKKELKDNNVDVKDIKDIILPVELMINGQKIELPDIDGDEPESSVSSIPTMDF